MNIPRPEYPRPQFVRESWQSLNGTWQFAFDHGNSGEPRGFAAPGSDAFTHEILVPFAPESSLSGIGYKDFMAAVWYRRTIQITEAQLTGRVLIQFGAVDYTATLWVNGKQAATHKGGYASFSADITPFLTAGENTLILRAQDDTRSPHQPHGKQADKYFSSGCDYTRTTGIWQTVWLEFVPTTRLHHVYTEADAFSGIASFRAEVKGESGGLTLHTELCYKGQTVAENTLPVHCGSNRYTLQVEDPKLWDVLQPNLYDIRYTLMQDDAPIDTVTSYLGFRTVTVEKKAICINGRPVYQRLVLDQGFYPDGIYTAPKDECFIEDIRISQALGFNGARLHEKVFDERFLYWADKMGYLVWGEFANWGLDHTRPECLMNTLPEWSECVMRDLDHPALIGWCPFNETWDLKGRRQDDRNIEITYRITKLLDPSRPVIDTSGNYHTVTDIYDVHDYEQDPAVFGPRYGEMTLETPHEPYPERQRHNGEPYFISEYGGIWWAPGVEGGWGYGERPRSEDEAVQRYLGLTKPLLENPEICAFCYTQLYDVEQEQNGLYTYERGKKFSDENYKRIAELNRMQAGIEK